MVERRRSKNGTFLPDADTFDQYVCKMPSGCWEWTGSRTEANYGQYRRKGAHRASYIRYKGPIPPGMFVCHKCDNPPCVNPDHLWLGTRLENIADMVSKNRAFKWKGLRTGTANPSAKLTEEQVSEIRALRGTATQAAIGKRFGVSANTICHIYTGRKWASG